MGFDKVRYKLRVKFTKEKDLRFISHLDIVNLFVRSLRRAGIPMDYSGGFNPRPKIDISFALPLGIESKSEFADFVLTEKMNENFFMESMSKELPDGIKILHVFYIPEISESLNSTFNLARYEVIIPEEVNMSGRFIEDSINKFMSNPDKTIMHWRKNGKIKVDISDIVKCIEPVLPKINMILKIGPQKNIRPQEILSAIFGITEKDMLSWRLVRTELSEVENG